MARYHGKSGVVYLSTTGAGTAVNVVSLSTWNVDASTDTVEVTAFTDTNKVYVQGLRDCQGQISGWWDSADTTIFTGSTSADGVKMYLYPSANAPSKYLYGPAWIDAKIDTGVSDAVKISSSFKANGAWGFLI